MNIQKSAKRAANIAVFGIKSWVSDKRMLIAAAVLTVITAQYCSELGDHIRALNGTTNIFAVLTHMYGQHFQRLNIQFGMVLMFSNAPFHRDDSLFCVARSGYKPWCAGQILYIIISSVFYVSFIFLLTITFSIPTFGASASWGEAFSKLAANHLCGVRREILMNFTPLGALFHTAALLTLLSVVIGLLMFLLGNTVGRGAGTIAASALVLLGCVPNVTQYVARVIKLSPCSLTELKWIDPSGAAVLPSLGYSYTFLGIMAAVLAAANIFTFSNKQIRVYAYNLDV